MKVFCTLIFVALCNDFFIGAEELTGKPCVNTTIVTNSDDETREIDRTIVKKLFDIPTISWDANAKRLHELIKSLEYGGKTYQFVRNYALLVRLLRSRFEKYIINACPFSQAINDAAKCLKDKDPSGLANRVWARDLYPYIANVFLNEGLNNIGCNYGYNKVQRPYWKCANNGFTYDINTIWDAPDNNFMPEEIKSIVKMFYNSSDIIDRYLAVIATFALSNTNTGGMNRLLYFELINFLNMEPVPRRCCKVVGNRLKELTDIYKESVLKTVALEEEFYRQPEACK